MGNQVILFLHYSQFPPPHSLQRYLNSFTTPSYLLPIPDNFSGFAPNVGVNS